MPQKTKSTQDNTPSSSNNENTTPQSTDTKAREAPPQESLKTPKSATEAFDEAYLRQVTADFADDIERLRSAPDFKESSVPVLIQALKQGAANFSDEEKRRVVSQADGPS